MTKKELLQLRRERDKLERSLGGIRDMARVPSAIWVVDTKKEHIAVSEARKLGIPVIAILDTNCDPDEVTYPIPGNDDAIRSVSLLTRVVADAVADGLIARAGAADGEDKPSAAPSPASSARKSRWRNGSAVLEGKPGDDAAAQAPRQPAPRGTRAPEARRAADAPAAEARPSADGAETRPTGRRPRRTPARQPTQTTGRHPEQR